MLDNDGQETSMFDTIIYNHLYRLLVLDASKNSMI